MWRGRWGARTSPFLAWVTSFKSGKRDLLYHRTDKRANVCLNLETLKSVYKPAWSLPDSGRLYLNAFMKQHSCEMHPCAFFRYILPLYFSVMHLGKLYKQKINPDSKSWKKEKAIEKLLDTIQRTAICREKYETLLNSHHDFEQKGNTEHCLIQNTW